MIKITLVKVNLIDEETLIDSLRDHGIKVTPQRLAICKDIFNRDDHPTVEMVHASLHEDFPTLSVATVYKTVQLLKDIGFLQEVKSSSDGLRYDPNMGLHINLICSKCEQISDAKTENLSALWEKVITDLGIEPEGQVINVFYTCEQCKSNSKKPQ